MGGAFFREVEVILVKGGHYFLEQSTHTHAYTEDRDIPTRLSCNDRANSCSSGHSTEVKFVCVCSIVRWLLSWINTFLAAAKAAPSLNADRQIG